MLRECDHDYAHAMFAESARNSRNLAYVEGLLKNLRAKTAGQKRRRLHLTGSGGHQLKKALRHQQWPQVLRLGLDLVKDDPWNVTTLRAIAEACAALHYPNVELAYSKQALDANPKDIEVNRHCARSLARVGQFDQAIACWHRVETVRGMDDEAAGMISRLSERRAFQTAATDLSLGTFVIS
jgi:hypothetical protein